MAEKKRAPRTTQRRVPFTLGVVGHFGLAVRDPKQSAKWWEKAVGLTTQFEFEDGVAIGNDNITIALQKGTPRPPARRGATFQNG